MRTHEAWKKIYIRDQWNFDDLSDEFKYQNFRALDNDSALVICIGA